MKLYEAPNKSKIYETVSDGSKYFIYDHPDGMYGYCVSEKGAIIHLGITTELVKYKDGYKIAKSHNPWRGINKLKAMKKLTYDQFCKEVDKLKKKAAKINQISGHVMVMVVTRIKRK